MIFSKNTVIDHKDSSKRFKTVKEVVTFLKQDEAVKTVKYNTHMTHFLEIHIKKQTEGTFH